MPTANTYQNWTTQEEVELELLVKTNKYSHKQIGEILNRPYNSILSKCRRLKINSLFVNRNYYFDFDFWKEYTPENCYLAGFIAADGSIINNSLKIEIHKKDIEVLYYLIDNSKSNSKIFKSKDNLVSLQMTSPIWIKDLANNFGIIPNKKNRISIPNNLSLYLSFCWLIGYTDGDGCINIVQVNENKSRVGFSWTSASIKCLEQIKNIIDVTLPTGLKNKSRKIKKLKHANAYQYNVAGIPAIVLYLFLKNFSTFKLLRKWDNQKINNYIEFIKNKKPDIYKKIINDVNSMNSLFTKPSFSCINI